jgi:hypothetical protein
MYPRFQYATADSVFAAENTLQYNWWAVWQRPKRSPNRSQALTGISQVAMGFYS